MTELEKIVQWLSTYPGNDRLQSMTVDLLALEAETGNIIPSGLTELSRREDALGNVRVENQYRLGLYYVLTKTGGSDNAAWILGLQQWVQEQSIRGLAPTFGDEPGTERVLAQNGVLYAEGPDGTATYRVELTINFKKTYEED